MNNRRRIAIIGGGPAGLMAADVLCAKGLDVDLYDAMPSLGRKFLMAGKSGLNLTHAEPHDAFAGRFAESRTKLSPILDAYPPMAIRDWATGLGIETFIGSSGRIFPTGMKAAPLLRAWLRQLRARGLRIHVRHKWTGWTQEGALLCTTPSGAVQIYPDATVLALGGASWPKLGSDGAWVIPLLARGVAVNDLEPANCGFDVNWSDHLRQHFEGQPLKGIAMHIDGHKAQGECMVTAYGLEGGPVYTLSAILRTSIKQNGKALLNIDLTPGIDEDDLAERIARPRGKKSMATHLRRTVGLTGIKSALLHENGPHNDFHDPGRLAARIKNLTLTLQRPRPIAEAISTSGGISWDQVTDKLELKTLKGVYVAGEMLDWEAPTGGYLLSACLATGRWVGEAIASDMGAD